MGLHIPKPCVALGSGPVHHKLACKQLRLSQSSLFSPPFDSGHQPTLGLTGKCLPVPSGGVAFEATALELHSQLKEKMEHSQVEVDREMSVEQLRSDSDSDSMVTLQEAVTTPAQEMNMETPSAGGNPDSQGKGSDVAIPPSGVDSEISGNKPALGSNTIVKPVVMSSEHTAAAVGLSVSDSDTEEGEIVDSEGEEKVFDKSKREGEVVGNGVEEGEIVDSGGEGECEIVDGVRKEETVDSRSEEEGEKVDEGKKEEMVDEGEKGEVFDQREKETVDRGVEEGEVVDEGEEEGEIVDRGEEKTVDIGREEEDEVVDRGEEEIVGNNEEEKGEIIDTVRVEEWEVVDKGEQTGGAEEGSQETRRWSARLKQGRTENRFSPPVTPANNLWAGRKHPKGQTASLSQMSRQQIGVRGKRASSEKVNVPPRKKQRISGPISCQSPPALEATPESLLPGYQLRSRCVNFWQPFPKRRRLCSSESKVLSPNCTHHLSQLYFCTFVFHILIYRCLPSPTGCLSSSAEGDGNDTCSGCA